MIYDVVFYPWRDFNHIRREGYRTREANILKELLNRDDIGRVLCINRSGQPKLLSWALKFSKKYKYYVTEPQVKFNDERKLYDRIFSNLSLIGNKLYVLDLKYHIPNPKGNMLEEMELFRKILKKELDYAISYLQFKECITWGFDLSRAKLLENITYENKIVVFDAIDNLLEHNQIKHKDKVKNNYDIINDRADLIFTVSQSIKDDIFHSKSNVHWIPNGIDLGLFENKESGVLLDMPIGKPIIGYVGLLQERIDVDLMIHTVSKLKGYNFVFVGPILTPDHFTDLRKYPNVFFLGSKKHTDIPQYIQHFDVCILPHKVNKFTKSMNPLKIYEYLAAKKQIVTTRVPPSEDFNEVLFISDTKEEFTDSIIKAVNEPFSTFSIDKIKHVIVEHDWKNRVDDMINVIKAKGAV